ITRDGEGGVSSVSAALVVTDIPPGPGGRTSAAVSSQMFSIEFRLDETADEAVTKSQDLGNLVERARSGNPGYLTGLPLLAGTLQSSGILHR
ncbi:unnamed protein product, partial [Sphacelaria rigidula]